MRIPNLRIDRKLATHVLEARLAAPRRGIMLHYDDSSRDDWAVEWFTDPRCTNGYTWLVLDTGLVIELADPGMRTPHAGPCTTPFANSAYYGISAATNGLVPATPAQLDSIAMLCSALARYHKWEPGTIGQRLVGHDAQAVWTPKSTSNRLLWGHVGRKVDPTGVRHDGRAIIDVRAMRERVRSML